MSEYGVQFGRTYGEELLTWVYRHYAPIQLWGTPQSARLVLMRYARSAALP